MIHLNNGLRYTREEKSIVGAYDEQGPGIDGPLKTQRNGLMSRAVFGLQNIAAALAAGQAPTAQSLNAIAPFQQAGWGYFFLGSAAVMPRLT